MTKTAKASVPREIGFNHEAMSLPRNSDIRLAACRFEQRKVARRMFSVFDQLATNGKTVAGTAVNGKLEGGVVYPPTLTKPQAVAGNNMFTLYAVWKGLAGASDRDDIGFVEGGTNDRELLTDRMKLAGEQWKYILTGVGKDRIRTHKPMDALHVKLLTALCHDMLTSDGAMIDVKSAAPKVRWREVVRTVCGINDRECQRDAVKRMTVDLERAARAAKFL